MDNFIHFISLNLLSYPFQHHSLPSSNFDPANSNVAVPHLPIHHHLSSQ